MNASAAASVYSKPSAGVGAPAFHPVNAAFQNHSSTMPNNQEGISMGNSNGNFARKFRGENPATNSRAPSARPTTPALTDWFTDRLRHLTTKEVAALMEGSERAAENVKLGKCAPNAASMTAMFRNSPELGALYIEYIGLLLPGQAEMAAAYTRFANAAVRKGPT